MREMYEDANSRMEAQDSRGGEEVRGAVEEFKKAVAGYAAEAGVPAVDKEVRSGHGKPDAPTQEQMGGRRRKKSISRKSSVRDSSPEPSLSSGDSGRDSETDLDESETPGLSPVELELQGMSVLKGLNFVENRKAKRQAGDGEAEEDRVLVAEGKYFYKMEPTVTVLDLPGAWRWS